MTQLLAKVYDSIQHFISTVIPLKGAQVVVYMRNGFLDELLKELYELESYVERDQIKSRNKIFGYTVYKVADRNHPPFTVALIKEEHHET